MKIIYGTVWTLYILPALLAIGFVIGCCGILFLILKYV